MQNLIRIGIANAAQNARISKSPLEGSVLDRERVAKSLEIAREHIDATGIDAAQPLLSLEKMQGRTAFGTRFRKNQRTMREVEGGQIVSPRQLRAGWPPVQSPRNHQMKHQPE